MRVLLVRPPRRDPRQPGLSVPPLGLAYIGSALRAEGHAVELVDAWALRWSWARYEAEVRHRKPDLVGITAMTAVAELAHRAARLARPHARWIVLGGPHPTARGAAVLTDMPALDCAVSGEGERVVGPLLAWLEVGSRGAPPPGVLTRDHPLRHAARPADLDALPRPARDLLPRHLYRYPLATRRHFATMITSRGCPFHCSFCDKAVGGDGWRARSAEDVVDELADLVRQGVGFVNLYDDNFTLRRSRVRAICEQILRQDLRVDWKCEARVDGVDLPLLRLMRRAGCRVVAYGVESAHEPTLRLLRKDTDLDTVRRAFAWTRQAGLRAMAYLILGAPGETADDVRTTLRFCHELRADYAQFSTLSAMPGAPLWDPTLAVGGGANPLDADTWRHTLSDLPPATLDRLMRQAWAGFYLRPRTLARVGRDALRSGSVVELGRLATAWGRWARS